MIKQACSLLYHLHKRYPEVFTKGNTITRRTGSDHCHVVMDSAAFEREGERK
jgi:hypothetical protein